MTPADDRDPVDVLAEEFADRLRRGEHPSVADFAARHPAHADQLRELLPAVAQMEQLKRFRKTATVVDRSSLPDRLGDFRIVRELGRGGMGVVFEAVQESLGRRVALKVVAANAQLDPDRRERFIREAKAAARLHHTNIVPVFGVGSQDGLPYYVMQLIPGLSLQAVAAGWRQVNRPEVLTPKLGEVDTTHVTRGVPNVVSPTPDGPHRGDWAFVAAAGVQAADALHYAHEQGVLHRDVKPANLLLDDHGRVWVTDFGVAKIVDSGTLTATGDILGTLHYLAPECLHGTADPRSDVYGLGAALYELITLVPPFAADTPAALIKQIADTDPIPPRSLNPAIPRDLETIVLKAMAREPAGRYAAASLLAEDLRSFLEDRPIRARRMTAVGRGWRWCRRNPAVATLSFSTLAAMVLAAVVGWVGYVRTQAALEAEAKKRDEAEEASARLEANLRLCLESFETVFEKAGGNEFRPPVPGFVGRAGNPPGPQGGAPPPVLQAGGPLAGEVETKAEVLEAVLTFYDRFAEQNATNPRLQLEAAKAHRRVGEVHQWRGRADKAAASFRRAASLLADLDEKFPESDAVRFELMQVYTTAPVEVFGGREPGAAERQFGKALELARGKADPSWRWATGTVWLKLGWAREQAGDRANAMAAYREAVHLLGPPPGGGPRPGHVMVQRTIARQRLAGLLTASREFREAEEVLTEAIIELRPWTRGEPGPTPAGRQWFAAVCLQLADVRDLRGDGRGAMAIRDEAARVMGPFGPGPGGPKKDGSGPFGGPKKDGPQYKDGPPPKK